MQIEVINYIYMTVLRIDCETPVDLPLRADGARLTIEVRRFSVFW